MNMKHTITKFLALVLLSLTGAMSAEAVQFTSVTVRADMGNGAQSIQLPAQGMPVQDLTQNATQGMAQFVIDGFEAMVDGTATEVNFVGAAYKAISTSDGHWRTIPGSEMNASKWGLSGLNVDLLEDLEEGTVYIFEFYIEGTDKSGNKFYYNNGGSNYRIKLMKKSGGEQPSGPVTFDSAKLLLICNGEYKGYAYEKGTFEGSGNDLGTVSSLTLDTFGAMLVLADGVTVKDFSAQCKVYEQGSGGTWNRIDTNEPPIQDQNSAFYAGSMLNYDLLQNCTPGNSYYFEIMLQAIDNEGHYYFFGRDDEHMRFSFTMGEPVAAMPEIASLIIDANVNGEYGVGYLEHEGQEAIDLGEVSEFTIANIGAWLVDENNEVEELWMDYAIYDHSKAPQSSDWKRIDLPNLNTLDGEWGVHELNMNVLAGLAGSKKYCLELAVTGRYGDNQIYYNNGGSNYRITFTPAGGSQPGEPGDVDGNNVVNGSDVTALYNFLLNGASTGGNADVDGNGTVNGSDVTALYNLLLK